LTGQPCPSDEGFIFAAAAVVNTWIMHTMKPCAAFDVASSTC
jgi:hypothetical protein